MAFQIYSAETRLARMLTWFSGVCTLITDFFVGSKLRTKFETLAVEMEQMDTSWYIAINKTIPVAIYEAFNFQILAATRASGAVTFTANPAPAADIQIPAGTLVSTAATDVTEAKVFQTATTVTIPSGQTTVTVTVSSTVTGTLGNAGINTVNELKSIIGGITSVTNLAAITNGADRESESARRLRFIEYIASLKRGTVAAIVAGAKTATVLDDEGIVIEQVQQALCTDPGTPVGNIICYIYNGVGGTTDDLADAAQLVIDGYTNVSGTKVSGFKAAGIVCTVVKATEIAQAVTVGITKIDGYNSTSVEMAVRDAILTYIKSLGVGVNMVRHALIERIMRVPGVYNSTVTTPAADVTVAEDEVVAPTGTITVTITVTVA